MKYKTGDKVLVEAEIKSIKDWGIYLNDRPNCVDSNIVRPYTPRQEFEYGEEVEAKQFPDDDKWKPAIFIGRSFRTDMRFQYAVNFKNYDGTLEGSCLVNEIRKPKPRETITIGNTTYDKAELEKALKDLKPIGEVK